jgi:hypothetical protein
VNTPEIWVPIAVNIVLVVVTAVYVALTRSMAKSSQAAAESAAVSARATLASVEADANQRQAWFKTGGGGGSDEHWEITVRPLVGAYELRKVVLLDVSFMPTVDDVPGMRSSRRVDVNVELEPMGQSFPIPVDEIAGATFEVDIAALARRVFDDDRWQLLHWSCEVTYSLSKSSDIVRRVVVFSNAEMDPRFYWLRQERDLGLR